MEVNKYYSYYINFVTRRGHFSAPEIKHQTPATLNEYEALIVPNRPLRSRAKRPVFSFKKLCIDKFYLCVQVDAGGGNAQRVENIYVQKSTNLGDAP